MKSLPQKLHFLGIGGIGMSGLARALHAQGHSISGFDQKKTALSTRLEKEGIAIDYGDDSPFNPSCDTAIIWSSAFSSDHPYLSRLKTSGYELFHRSELLSALAEKKWDLAVAGSHGKTSTSSMLAYLLCQLDPSSSYVLGGELVQGGMNAELKEGRYCVYEADESDGSFLNYHPQMAIITNLDTEHLQHYKSEENLHKAFLTFARQVKGPLLWCGDCPRLKALSLPGKSYGFCEDNDFILGAFKQEGWRLSFDLSFSGKYYERIEVEQIGRHQALNAAAVFACALELGFSQQAIRAFLLTYRGVKRRTEKLLSQKSLTLIDDYAHHPTEVQSTLKALRETADNQRVVVVFQAHRYSRFLPLYQEFVHAFKEADLLLVAPLYSAGESPPPDFSLARFCQEVQRYSQVTTLHVQEANWMAVLQEHLCSQDRVIFLGAGSITHWAHQAAKHFTTHPLKKVKVAVIAGGKSSEYTISLQSAKNLASYLDKELYDPYFIHIDREGNWSAPEKAFSVDQIEKLPCDSLAKQLPKIVEMDFFFPIVHGQNGEDGTLQGFFEVLDKPYAGCNVFGASLCMNKARTKQLLAFHSLPTAKWKDFTLHQWKTQKNALLKKLKTLCFPVFVKGCHLGSSVGVFPCETFEDLEEVIYSAFTFDHHILVEEKVKGREVEFAVIGNQAPSSSQAGEILTGGGFYSYDKKYGKEGFTSSPRADIPIAEGEYMKKEALRAYKKLGCRGFARVDGFYTPSKELWINEINPIPGFTSISLFPKMWEEAGKTPSELINDLIALGMQRKREESFFIPAQADKGVKQGV